MLKKILIALVLVVAGICLFALTKPDRHGVTRSTLVDAPPEHGEDDDSGLRCRAGQHQARGADRALTHA